MSIDRVASWITIVTGPTTAITTVLAWTGRLDPDPTVASANPILLSALTLLLGTCIWSFAFWAQVRLFKRLAEHIGDEQATVFLVSVVVAVPVAVLHLAAQMLAMDGLIRLLIGPGEIAAIATVISVFLLICSVFVGLLIASDA